MGDLVDEGADLGVQRQVQFHYLRIQNLLTSVISSGGIESEILEVIETGRVTDTKMTIIGRADEIGRGKDEGRETKMLAGIIGAEVEKEIPE